MLSRVVFFFFLFFLIAYMRQFEVCLLRIKEEVILWFRWIACRCLSRRGKNIWLGEKGWVKNEKKIDNIYGAIANKNYFLNGHLKFSYSIQIVKEKIINLILSENKHKLQFLIRRKLVIFQKNWTSRVQENILRYDSKCH